MKRKQSEQITEQSEHAITIPSKLRRGALCSICAHPRKAEIDAALIDSKLPNYAHTAKLFAVDRSSLRRHREKHVPASLLGMTSPAVVAIREEREDAILTGIVLARSEARMKRIQSRLDGLQAIIDARAANEAHADVPGHATGLLVVKERWQNANGRRVLVKEAALDGDLLAQERALFRQMALETGEHLTQQGRAPFGHGDAQRGPMVVVVPMGLGLIHGDEAGPTEARHVVQESSRYERAQRSIPAPVPLRETDVEMVAEDAGDTRERSLSGIPSLEIRGPRDVE